MGGKRGATMVKFGNRSDSGRPINSDILFTSNLGEWLTGNKWLTFYLGVARDSSGNKNEILFPESFTSEDSSTISNIDFESFTKIIDLDFDFTMSSDRLIGGDFIGRAKVDGNGAGTEIYIIYKVIHYDGTTETLLGQARMGDISVSSNVTDTIASTITKKHFRTGDILRITLEGWGKTFAPTGAGKEITVFHDGVTSLIKIPFINLDEY